MLLNEFIYFDQDSTDDMEDHDRYDPASDVSVIDVSDLRKCRLTLKMLNKLRKAGDARAQENKEELLLVKRMYAVPAPVGGGMAPPMM